MIEEDKHWWFAGRTRSILTMLDRHLPPDGNHRVLDVGCGAGNMVHHLARYGPVVGVDNDPRPLAVARSRGYEVCGGEADELAFADESFDLVSLLDTVEHCPDDLAVLRACYRVCKPDGRLVITAPAFQWLWGPNDVLNAHMRRYTVPELRSQARRAGFHVERISYNNAFLLPMAAAMIALRRVRGQAPQLGSPHIDDESYQVEMEPVAPTLNRLLGGLTWVETLWLRRFGLPAGTSIICIAHKPKD